MIEIYVESSLAYLFVQKYVLQPTLQLLSKLLNRGGISYISFALEILLLNDLLSKKQIVLLKKEASYFFFSKARLLVYVV